MPRPAPARRGDHGHDDALGTTDGQRLDRRPEAAPDGAASHALERSHERPVDAVDPGAPARPGDAESTTDVDRETDSENGGDGADHATVRQAPACPIAVPVDGVGQSLPAPSGQAPAEPALVAEVAAVSGTAVPAAGSVAAAVDPLTTAAAALPAQVPAPGVADVADRCVRCVGASAALRPRFAGDGMPVITGITVETTPVTAAPVTAAVRPGPPTPRPPPLCPMALPRRRSERRR